MQARSAACLGHRPAAAQTFVNTQKSSFCRPVCCKGPQCASVAAETRPPVAESSHGCYVYVACRIMVEPQDHPDGDDAESCIGS